MAAVFALKMVREFARHGDHGFSQKPFQLTVGPHRTSLALGRLLRCRFTVLVREAPGPDHALPIDIGVGNAFRWCHESRSVILFVFVYLVYGAHRLFDDNLFSLLRKSRMCSHLNLENFLAVLHCLCRHFRIPVLELRVELEVNVFRNVHVRVPFTIVYEFSTDSQKVHDRGASFLCVEDPRVFPKGGVDATENVRRTHQGRVGRRGDLQRLHQTRGVLLSIRGFQKAEVFRNVGEATDKVSFVSVKEVPIALRGRQFVNDSLCVLVVGVETESGIGVTKDTVRVGLAFQHLDPLVSVFLRAGPHPKFKAAVGHREHVFVLVDAHGLHRSSVQRHGTHQCPTLGVVTVEHALLNGKVSSLPALELETGGPDGPLVHERPPKDFVVVLHRSHLCDFHGREPAVGLLHAVHLGLCDQALFVEALEFSASCRSIDNAALDVGQELDTPNVIQGIVCRIAGTIGKFWLVILNGTDQNPVQLQGKVYGLLGNDETESLQNGIVPLGFEVDDHVRQLRKIKFDSLEDVSIARELGNKSRHEFDNVLVVPELPNDHHNLFHRNLFSRFRSQHLIDEFVAKILVFFLCVGSHRVGALGKSKTENTVGFAGRFFDRAVVAVVVAVIALDGAERYLEEFLAVFTGRRFFVLGNHQFLRDGIIYCYIGIQAMKGIQAKKRGVALV
mmetsp:Transcript_3576/g.8611  ORF Transcript_3576/g.8611 Transcript_3576/m.8611 type:complete len:674 (+) Transcript_3576:1160-3181(+)